MAGWGSRLRPHTLTIPKPMVPIAGKPIVQRLVESLVRSVDGEVEEVHFVIREEFGIETETKLKEVAASLNTDCKISYQASPEGTAHAIDCAKESLEGNVIVAFADTLFESDFTIDPSKDGIIWVNKVENPKAFGVVKLDQDNIITDFIEKPQEFVSDLAIIGIYYFKDGAALANEIDYLIKNNIRVKGEFQLTDALESLKAKGAKFVPGEVHQWMDCGNKNACIDTNERILELIKNAEKCEFSSDFKNSVVIQPCFIGENVQIENSIIGPHVSVGAGSTITNSIVKNSIIQTETSISNVVLEEAMIGNKVQMKGTPNNSSLGDYTTV